MMVVVWRAECGGNTSLVMSRGKQQHHHHHHQPSADGAEHRRYFYLYFYYIKGERKGAKHNINLNIIELFIHHSEHWSVS